MRYRATRELFSHLRPDTTRHRKLLEQLNLTRPLSHTALFVLHFSIHCFFIYFLNVNPVNADHSIPHTLHKSPIVDQIIIKGLHKTKAHVVRRELLFREADALTGTLLLDSIQRLKNLRIFTRVLPYIELKKNHHIRLTLVLEERWTTIPYANINSGGDTFYANAGAYDINAFGRFIEVGAQYDNWDGENGGVLWYRNPRILDKRLLGGIDLWSSKRPRSLFTPSGENQGNYIIDQKKLKLLFETEIRLWFVVGLDLQFSQTDIFSINLNKKIDSYTADLLSNSASSSEISATFSTRIGKLNYDNYLISGKQSTLFLKYAGEEIGSEAHIKKIVWENTIFWRLPHTANAALRFNAAAIETNLIQNLFYVGGFKHIRGYYDGQFRSKAYWLANAEYRIPSLKNNWLVIQHIFFLDVANASNRLSDLSQLKKTIFSAGMGLRVISPKVYSFNGRIDIALLSSQKTQSYISFGAQQFF